MRLFAICSASFLACLFAASEFVRADGPADAPRPVPLTRPEMKQMIESVKVRTPRIPLPELTDQERERRGDREGGYESRLRSEYMSRGEERRSGGRANQAGGAGAGRFAGGGRDDDPEMTLSYPFKVELFWIVSRSNNCQYCLGHQESKLLAAGLSEDRIAALDGDWLGFTPAEQAAYAFARRFTYEPHLLCDADVNALRPYYTDPQILEMIVSMAGNNSINRWKEGVAVPQRKDEGGYARVGRNGEAAPAGLSDVEKLPRGSYLTPTSPAFEKMVSRVAPIKFDAKTGQPTTATVCVRPPLESREEVERTLAACRERTSRLPLVDEARTREVVADAWPSEEPLPNWVRLLATFPRAGLRTISGIRSADESGDLSPLLKGQLSWIIARQDRAWYAVGQAQHRLRDQQQTDEQIFALDGDWQEFTPRERSLFTVAKKLAASPVVLTDADVAQAVELAGPRDVVQTISYTTNRASFNRITEAAGLPIEE